MKKCLKIILLILLVLIMTFSTSNMSFAIVQNIAEKEDKNIENTENTNSNTSNSVIEEKNNVNEEKQENNVIQEEIKENNENKENTIQDETENTEKDVTKIEEEQIKVQTNSVLKSGTYVGDSTHQILEIHFDTNANGSGYIWGKLIYIEWINGLSTVPSKNPTITLKNDEENKNYECYVKQEWGNTYYFDIFIDGFDFNETYNFEVSSGDENNVSENKVSNLKIDAKTLSEYKDYKVSIQENKLTFEKITYVGDSTHQILEIHLNKNSDGSGYIWGKFIYIEWVNGVSTVPRKNPTVTIKDDGESKSYACYVKQEWGNTYYFDIFVDSLDYNKTYNFEIASGDSRNISKNQVSNLKINNQNLGENKDYYVLIQNNQLT